MKKTAEEDFKEKQALMSDSELIELAKAQVSELAKTGGRSHRMCVPPSIKDTDMLFSELIRRFEFSSQDKWVSVETVSLENAEKVWDKMSEQIGTDIGSLDYYAGKEIMTKESFFKLCSLLPSPPKTK